MRKALALVGVLGLMYDLFAKKATANGHRIPDVKQLGQIGMDRVASTASSSSRETTGRHTSTS